VDKVTTFSPDRVYRYTLWRRWNNNGYAMFIGLNPSTADETVNDPTIRRCIAYARDWGYGALCMTNLFAFRATHPATLGSIDDPVGPDNDTHLLEAASGARIIVACWGVNGIYKDRNHIVSTLLSSHDMYVLRLTKNGHPAHPLYLPTTLTPKFWLPHV
jgi:hypothetical protein